ncbi:hypothetical protein EZV62_018116 [Acer yangbiense]|uniref:Mediator of RNA polymerase II transcription subunit 25 n=1 Tax=Acer yangbiense TaxID=1000413 RepID=A0A5C7HIE2_9ROSI|nr:hypothetical protein EZV62_018116 [Acer yangbiense]
MADKKLIIAVEGTAAMGPFWDTVVTDYLKKIVRCFCSNELAGQEHKPLAEYTDTQAFYVSSLLSKAHLGTGWIKVSEWRLKTGQCRRQARTAVDQSPARSESSSMSPEHGQWLEENWGEDSLHLNRVRASPCALRLNASCSRGPLRLKAPNASNNYGRLLPPMLNSRWSPLIPMDPIVNIYFYFHPPFAACLVQRSGWTKDVDIFLHWLSTIPFAGGGFNDAAIAEGLSEALMMFSNAPNGSQNQQNVDGQKHCILVTASNPHPLPTPVYRPQIQNLEQSENIEAQTESRLSDAETLAKSFDQCSVSLSIICPKQLPKVRAIYNAAKRNPRAADPPVDNGKNPQFLLLISENFMEARAALSRPGVTSLASNQNPVKMDIAPVASVTGPAQTSIPSGYLSNDCLFIVLLTLFSFSVNGSMMNRQPISVGNVPTATVKVEPSTVSSMGTGLAYPHMPSVPRPASQGVPSLQTSSPSSTSQEMITNSDNVPELKPIVNGMSQPLRPGPPAAANVSILNNLSQARQVMNSAALTGGTGLQSMGQTPMAMHMSNMISTGMASSVPAAQTVFSSGQSGITCVTGSGTLTGTSQVPQNSSLNSFTSATSNMSGNSNLGISQPMGTIQGGVSMGQPIPGMSQGNHSGAQMVQSGISMNQNMMSGLGPSGVSSSGPGTMIPTPGMSQQAQSGMQQLGVNNNSAANMPLSQQTSSALQTSQSKYVKVWEGNLSGQRQGQPVFITKLEGYRSSSASETLAANWPTTMQIVRLISQDHMNNKQYVGKADFLVFRAMNQHGFLGQLQEKKLCAVIQLPSQTLLLSVSDKAYRLIGMLFPGPQQMVGSGMGQGRFYELITFLGNDEEIHRIYSCSGSANWFMDCVLLLDMPCPEVKGDPMWSIVKDGHFHRISCRILTQTQKNLCSTNRRDANSSRQAKWWYSTFHTVTAMIGAGVLSLPYAMAYLGWGPGTMVLVLSWCMTLHTMWQMIQLHECVPGTQFDRYIDLGRHAFGPKLGPWIVLPQQLIVQVGCDIVYMVTGGKCLKKFSEMACTNCTPIKQSYWILIFGSLHFFLSQLPNFNSVAGVSLAAAVMSLSYSTIAWAGCLSHVVLEIQATIPSTPDKPSKKPMWKGAVCAYFINAICYFPVAMIGYWVFGQDVDDNVLMALRRSPWLIAAANLMVVVHVIGSNQVYAMPVFDMLERMIMKKLNFPPGLVLGPVVRSAYVAFTLFVEVTFPFFGDLLGFFGGFGFAPTSYFLPSVMWPVIKKPKRFSINWFINWACIFVGVFIMLASTIGGFRNIVTDASTYSFYT